MGFFIVPQKWITPAIAAAALAFGGTGGGTTHVKYDNFPGKFWGGTTKPDIIWIDKRKSLSKVRAQCIVVHMYGHLAGRDDVSNPRNIMYQQTPRKTCVRWLSRHHVR